MTQSDAARSWGGSAVLGRQRLHAGVPPMSDCRGSPHSRFAVVSPTRALHQEHYQKTTFARGLLITNQ
ncbi:MAG: hypothetical protein F6K55_07000 [Moorea sp. SIO4A3]|nr:hypothetical protein [Moorena sp. SIO4A3]